MSDGTERHDPIPLVTVPPNMTEYRCLKCGRTGLDSIPGKCNIQAETEQAQEADCHE